MDVLPPLSNLNRVDLYPGQNNRTTELDNARSNRLRISLGAARCDFDGLPTERQIGVALVNNNLKMDRTLNRHVENGDSNSSSCNNNNNRQCNNSSEQNCFVSETSNANLLGFQSVVGQGNNGFDQTELTDAQRQQMILAQLQQMHGGHGSSGDFAGTEGDSALLNQEVTANTRMPALDSQQLFLQQIQLQQRGAPDVAPTADATDGAASTFRTGQVPAPTTTDNRTNLEPDLWQRTLQQPNLPSATQTQQTFNSSDSHSFSTQVTQLLDQVLDQNLQQRRQQVLSGGSSHAVSHSSAAAASVPSGQYGQQHGQQQSCDPQLLQVGSLTGMSALSSSVGSGDATSSHGTPALEHFSMPNAAPQQTMEATHQQEGTGNPSIPPPLPWQHQTTNNSSPWGNFASTGSSLVPATSGGLGNDVPNLPQPQWPQLHGRDNHSILQTELLMQQTKQPPESGQPSATNKKTKRIYRHESFPEKLFRMLLELEEQGRDDIVSFIGEGSAFLIHQPQVFEDEIIPNYFRHNKLASFKRQLSMYGFTRVTGGSDHGAYAHPMFLKTRPDLCKQMDRTS